jgi:hypothetical protein
VGRELYMTYTSDMTIPINESPEIAYAIRESAKDSRVFDKVFLHDNFYADFVKDLHDPIFDIINKKKPRKQSVVCATRGIGKSTIARGIAAKAICLAEKKYIVYIGKSATHAEMQTENLRKDLMSKRIRDVFGDIKARTPTDVEESWSKKSWVAMIGDLCPCGKTARGVCSHCNGIGDAHYTVVLPRGAGQQVRGLLYKLPTGENVRPDLIIIDDLEDSEFVDSEDWRIKNKEWFFGDVVQAVSKLECDKWWEMFYIDTLKHEDSLLQMLLDASDWDSLIAPICDENYKSKAPEFMSDEDIVKMVTSYREKGMMDVFAREIMCMAISKEDAEFKSDYFVYYDEGNKLFQERLPHIVNLILIDPAKTSKSTSGETGIIVWGVDLQTNRLYLRFAEGVRLPPDELFTRIIDLAVQYQVWSINIEDTGVNEFVTQPLRNEVIRRGYTYQVESLKARRGGKVKDAKGFEAGKIKRIKALSGYYRQGLISHNKVGIGAYELQLIGFPRSKRWDMIDCAAYIIQIMEREEFYFLSSQYHEKSEEDVEREYAELDEELDKIDERSEYEEDWVEVP